jgi:hypothetical protein
MKNFGICNKTRNICWHSMVALIGVIFLCLMVLMPHAKAQSSGGSDTDFSLFGGYMLPNQIPSVINILPLFGGRYAFDYPWGAVEGELENAHAVGVDWTQGSISFRAQTPISPGLDGMIYAGPDILWYIPNGATQRQFDYGVHVGIAGVMQVKDSLWVRGDVKFLGNPGTALYLLGGIMFR